jgi:Tol biopolymer transport system component
MPLAGGQPKMVSTGRGECTCAYFHPNGRKILFASTHLNPDLKDPDNPDQQRGYQRAGGRYAWTFHPGMDIFEADLDGSNLKRLTTEVGYDAEGAYSWDGKKIAFSSNRTGDMEIYIMNADGTDVKRITHRPGYDGGPFLSPDGTRIVYRSDPEQNDLLQIFMHDLRTGRDTQLTDNQAVNWAPYWHPNGRVIAFTSSLQGHRNYEVYLMDVESRRLVRVTYWPGNEETNGFDGLPVFSRDGKKLMWTSKRGPQATSQIWVADFHMPAELSGG